MGEVYKALDTQLNREVALKTLAYADNPERYARFQREAAGKRAFEGSTFHRSR
jgi:hypothetical protein